MKLLKEVQSDKLNISNQQLRGDYGLLVMSLAGNEPALTFKVKMAQICYDYYCAKQSTTKQKIIL